jgi:hypothetical protein
MASEGYPDEYRTGLEIFGIDDAEATGCTVYQAGTRIKDGRLIIGGRAGAGGDGDRACRRSRGAARLHRRPAHSLCRRSLSPRHRPAATPRCNNIGASRRVQSSAPPRQPQALIHRKSRAL